MLSHDYKRVFLINQGMFYILVKEFITAKEENVMDFLVEANKIIDEIVEIRRDIHRHPELGNQEFRTSNLVKEKLQEFGVDKIENPNETAIVATIKGNKDNGKCIAIRADMDALPVEEATGLDFASENAGVMHACGHDMHTSMMLGNAKMLCNARDQFEGTVKLIFQNSEEIMPGGAKFLVEKGVLDGVDAVLGMHVLPSENDEVGVVTFKEGPMATAVDEYAIEVIGTGGHGASPHKVPDPILAASQLIVLFQQVQARNVAPLDVAIFMMNKIEGGKVPNVISDRCTMRGNARTFSEETRKIVEHKVYDIAEGVEKISGCKINVNYIKGYDACINDPELNDFVRDTIIEKLGKEHYDLLPEPMGFSEDFGYYGSLTGLPTVIMMLKVGHVNDLVTLHNPHFAGYEEAMPYGMAAMCSSVVGFLNR